MSSIFSVFEKSKIVARYATDQSAEANDIRALGKIVDDMSQDKGEVIASWSRQLDDAKAELTATALQLQTLQALFEASKTTIRNLENGCDDQIAEKVDILVDKRLEFIRRNILSEMWDMLRRNDELYDDLLNVMCTEVIRQVRDTTNESDTYHVIGALMGMTHGTLKNTWPIANKTIRQRFEKWLEDYINAVELPEPRTEFNSDLPF